MSEKIEDGHLVILWNKNLWVPVNHDPYITAFAKIIERLTDRVAELERKMEEST